MSEANLHVEAEIEKAGGAQMLHMVYRANKCKASYAHSATTLLLVHFTTCCDEFSGFGAFSLGYASQLKRIRGNEAKDSSYSYRNLRSSPDRSEVIFGFSAVTGAAVIVSR
jgi:hypothetical protein